MNSFSIINIYSTTFQNISKGSIIQKDVSEFGIDQTLKIYLHANKPTDLNNPSKSKYNTEYTNNDKIDIKSSCKSIINYVNQRSKHDPLLSDDNPFKKGINI